METAASPIISSSLPHHWPPAAFRHRPTKLHRPNKPTTVIYASRRDTNGYGWDYGGDLVDENMIVLRKRIHEMKMAERNYEPPSHWMEWEKHYYTNYDSDVCKAVGALQTLLMNARPSVAVGMVALVMLSVPTPAIYISFHLLQALGTLLPIVHLG